MNLSTVEYKGIDLDVAYYVEPGQKEIIRADPNDSQEGFAPYVEVCRVYLKGIDITALLHHDLHEELAELLEASAG